MLVAARKNLPRRRHFSLGRRAADFRAAKEKAKSDVVSERFCEPRRASRVAQITIIAPAMTSTESATYHVAQ